jgi:hypothetical protein
MKMAVHYTFISWFFLLSTAIAQDFPKVMSTPKRIILPRTTDIVDEYPLGTGDESSNEVEGGGRELLRAKLILPETNCPYNDDGRCESAPTFLPASGWAFNHAGAVQVMTSRTGAEVRYTLDGSDPDRHSPGVIEVC